MENEYGKHYSVLKNECINFLTELNDKIPCSYADLTFGAGGHSSALAQLNPKAKVFCVDQDPDAIKNGEALLLSLNLSDRVKLLKMNFVDFPDYAQSNNLKLAGILLDLGVSSHQFDTFSRGFSFREDAPLDMRMDYQNDDIQTAADIVNTLSEKDLADLIFLYGEERYSRKIAREIFSARKESPITTTKVLENIIFHCYPPKERHRGPHPATRTFQALRIAVNSELDVLKSVIPELYSCLDVGGRLAIISFHSLEDRIVKHSFKEIVEKNPEHAKIISKKPILPSDQELAENPRSRSAKLRVLEKIQG